jgi:hypothetical protein
MMKNKLTNHDFEVIAALIREEEEALEYFRARNFRDRVENRFKEEARGDKPAARIHLRPVPVLAGVMVVIMAGIFIFVLNHPGAGRRSEFSALASAIGRLPGLSHPPEREWTGQSGQDGTFQLADLIRRTLVKAEQTKRQQELRVSFPAKAVKVPRLSLEQKMEILFQEKTIERVLMLLKDDSKEV